MSDGTGAGTRKPSNRLTVTENGPILADGDITLVDGERRFLSHETQTAFCRCGASSNKPFCDGSHAQIGFAAPAGLGEGRVKPADEATPHELTVRLRPDGPLLLDGAFLIGSEGSEATVSGSGCALCRCGASQRKPFCDGTHNSIGFEAADPAGS